LYASEVARVIYAPAKAFKEVIQNPRYIGPLLVAVLFIAANTGYAYALYSKVNLEKIMPGGVYIDEWTENTTYWTSNAVPVLSDDFINGTRYGNHSIEFSMNNSSQIWAQLAGIGTIDCASTYKVLSFRVKWTSPVAEPANVSIQIFSTDTQDYFYNTLTDDLYNATYDTWNNLTIPLASEGWANVGTNADWKNVTGLKLDFTWLESSNITLRISGLYFHGTYQSFLDSAGNSAVLNAVISFIMQFVILWILLSGLVYVLTRLMGGKTVWRTLMILVGLVLMTMVVQGIAKAVSYATLPALYYPAGYIGGVIGEGTAAADTIQEQTFVVTQVADVFLPILVLVWTVGLLALAVRQLTEFSWMKSFLVGIAAYLLTVIVSSLVLS
jgi:hypothetical protein